MNNKPELEDLFEAARRRKADLERQQKLAEMIDNLAAAEGVERGTENSKRRRIWAVVGIAASILLFVTVALRVVFQDDTQLQQGPVFADNGERKTDSVERFLKDPVVVPAVDRESVVLAYNKAVETVLQPIEESPVDSVVPVLMPEMPLLAEETETAPAEEQPAEVASRPRVFERTSTRLVCGEGCKPVRGQPEDTPLLAFINNSGTGTNFELGGISF